MSRRRRAKECRKSEIAFLLNDPKTPQSQIEFILKEVKEKVASSWSGILQGRPPEELPRVFEFCASVMAEKAAFALDKISAIASQTRKPTFTVYVLITAYKLKIERFSDQLREQGYSEREIYKLERAFYAEVEEKVKKGKSHTEARMEVGEEWLEKGLLSRFTQPLFIKIPSGSSPTAEAAQKLRKLSALAEKNNWDIIFVDHSTVRTKDAIHPGDPSDFEKGRAIARGLDIVDPKGVRRKWMFKPNGWSNPELDPSHPNMIGLNLYDGRIYESHVGGNKSDWLPVDDHGEFVGISWDAEGKVKRTDYLVITQNGDGKYHVYTAGQIFNRLLAESVAKLKKTKEKLKINVSNILFVCNANHDRSPLAEHLMRRLINHGVADADKISVSSAGLAVDSWLESEGTKKEFPYFPSSGTRRLLEQREIDYKAFKKRQIDQSAVEQSDVIFVMTKREKKVLLERFPQAKGKVFVLRGMHVEEQAQEILKNLARLEGDFERVMNDFTTMGKHIRDMFTKYEDTEKRLIKFSDKLESLTKKEEPTLLPLA